jgi:hypothetical protein
MAGSEGNHQTILGFSTECAADAWIADDKWLTDHTALWNHPSIPPRDPSRGYSKSKLIARQLRAPEGLQLKCFTAAFSILAALM